MILRWRRTYYARLSSGWENGDGIKGGDAVVKRYVSWYGCVSLEIVLLETVLSHTFSSSSSGKQISVLICSVFFFWNRWESVLRHVLKWRWKVKKFEDAFWALLYCRDTSESKKISPIGLGHGGCQRCVRWKSDFEDRTHGIQRTSRLLAATIETWRQVQNLKKDSRKGERGDSKKGP